ncbi:acyltransferase family protein [Streptomyces sp. 4F14]|uniref:acyltransferase family protein n=1 Tax=Streptomyces sp. 4F14 TaxID=3394380 RepID=UPI003A8A12F5
MNDPDELTSFRRDAPLVSARAQQAALFRAAASLPGIRCTDTAVDINGTTGVAVSLDDPALGRAELVFDAVGSTTWANASSRATGPTGSGSATRSGSPPSSTAPADSPADPLPDPKDIHLARDTSPRPLWAGARMTLLTAAPRRALEPPAAHGQLPSLTGMRWVAALLVFLHHIRNFGYFGGSRGQLVDWAFGPGAVGVSFFFVLSGFVLAWSARDGDSAPRFWRRRLARIYPLHLVTAVLALLLGATLIPGLRPEGAGETVANVFLVSSWWRDWWQALNPVSWSLTCEAFFYAVFPALYVVVRRLDARAVTGVLCLAALLVVVLPWAGLHHALGWIVPSNPAARLPEFVLGVAAGRLVRLGVWRGPGLDVSLALTVVGYFLTHQLPGVYGVSACTVLGLTLLVPAAAVADLRGLPSFWRRRRLVVLGEWSFAFYLIHILVLRLADQYLSLHHLPTLQALAATAAVLGVSVALARALHEGVERPGRRLLLKGVRRKAGAGPSVH